MEDRDIIRLYFVRSEEAIRATAQKYGAYLTAIAGRILADRQDAEECVEDTYLAAWQTVPPENPRNLAAFLGRITRNGALTRYRAGHAQKRQEGMTLLLSELEDCLPDPGGVEEAADSRELGRLLSRWLAILSKDDRLLFLRRYWFGDRVEDLAAQMGQSPNRTAQRLRRLRLQLRDELERQGVNL